MSGRALLARIGPLFGLIGVFTFFAIAVRVHTGFNSFATWGNLQDIVIQTSIVGMAALGMTLIIVSGGIDLSVGAAVALTSVATAGLLKQLDWSALPGALGAVAAGALCGLLNGLMVTRLKVVPFIITLGSSLMLRGLAKEIADNRTITPDRSPLDTLMDKSDFLAPGVWILAVMALGVSAMLHYSRFGRHVVAIGSNEAAARLCGVPVARTKLLVYVLGGFFTGLAGLFQFSRLSIGDPTSAPGLELDVIAAVVIGGASLSGGEGTIAGSLVGALFMTTISRGCSTMGWPNNRTEIVAGAIIIVAAALDRLRHRKVS
jgi:ribose/xylose/arabinose/galactoside ABC-type transport system permease subunit